MNTTPLKPSKKLGTNSSLEEKIHAFYQELLVNPGKKKPTNKEIALQLNTSESTFKVLFKKIYGCSPYQKYLDTKLEYAKKMLLSGEYQVQEVAHLIGYCQSSKFVQKFGEKVGETPGKYANIKKSS